VLARAGFQHLSVRGYELSLSLGPAEWPQKSSKSVGRVVMARSMYTQAAPAWYWGWSSGPLQEAEMSSPSAATGPDWWFATRENGQGVALVDWIALCDKLLATGSTQLAEDVKQLRDFILEVDKYEFVPWTTEQITDQDWARRFVMLRHLIWQIRDVGQQRGILNASHRGSVSKPNSAIGSVIYPADLWTALLADPDLQAEHGRSPLWLRWWNEPAETAREAFRDDGLIETGDGCALPVPLRAGLLRHEVVEDILGWLAHVTVELEAATLARAARGAPVATGEDDGGPDAPDEPDAVVAG
jgi:hypothetical protein